MHFLQDVFQMTAIALVSVINHDHINELNLFWDTLYIYVCICVCVCVCVSMPVRVNVFEKKVAQNIQI